MKRTLKQKLAAATAIAAVAAGGTIAAVSATGQVRTRPARATARVTTLLRASSAPHRRVDVAAAARYLGVSRAALRGELAGARTLAQIANATAGKSASGLIDALVTAKRAKLEHRLATLVGHVTNEVNGTASKTARARASGARAGKRSKHRHARRHHRNP